jgi:plastocyanin
MDMRSIYAFLPAVILAGCLVLGCGDKTNVGDTSPNMSMRTSADRVFVGDTITMTANTRNVLGKDARVDWHAAAGRVSTADDGRVARVVFDSPGTYTVSATLIVNGREVKREEKRVEVKPLP